MRGNDSIMTLTSQKRLVLKREFNNISSPAGFTGNVQKLFRQSKIIDTSITLADTKEFLRGERSYTLHRGNLVRFPRRKILAPKPSVIIACDLGDFCNLRQYNKGVKYLLVCVDVFSRLMAVEALLKKDSKHMLKALSNILEKPEFRGVRRIFTDRGTEFYNKTIQNYLNKKHIKMYSVYSDMKASIVERAIRTLKHLLYRYMTQTNSLKYLEVLSKVVEVYNNTYHRTIKATPRVVHNLRKIDDIRRQFKTMYINNSLSHASISPRLKVGTYVRLAKRRNTFHKSFWPQNTEEIFKVAALNKEQFIPAYKIIDLSGENISGEFYEQELIPTTLPEHFPVIILRSRKTTRGQREYYVNWRGYPSSSNSWVKSQDIINLNNASAATVTR